ncbi:glycosyl hydrolase family 28 protein [Paenibacillus roseipurpureus]|uniref:Glycosyl hydrolase family 28 protein n=1 Tax=Paenibacillus roseopurpureus TaxID=2918901 RepID=A0AA96LTB4_9BACL|nr:glycosyl hydrolase family 28 protein [Paenibacillus sp. MBLB1832]WNR46136.1 glycosyl hydrolase family 28 protein [Paenibacillus sp. MBLB1832]
MITSKFTSGMPASEIVASIDYKVRINGTDCFVYVCESASYVIGSGEGPVTVEIETPLCVEQVKVRPLSKGIQPKPANGSITLEVQAPIKLSIEFGGDIRKPLFLLINPPENNRPDPSDLSVKYYRGGAVYDAGEIILNSGETVYIEEGAVVRGHITAPESNGARIAGRGILDGSGWRTTGLQPYEKRKQMIKAISCNDLEIEGITVVDGSNWHVVPIGSHNVTIRNLNVITFEGTGDGCDIVGCENVVVDNCFIRAKDDCLAVKAVDYHHEAGLANVKNVLVQNCVFWNAEWGNCMEIGYETRCDTISGVTFRNIDVMRCEFEGHQSGGVFTIHNGDRAVIQDILYEDIRVEDAQEKLVDIKVLDSKYSRDTIRGQVDGVTFRNIQVIDGLFPVSIIRGWSEEHMIRNIRFEGLTVHGEPVKSANDARMVVELAVDVSFQ